MFLLLTGCCIALFLAEGFVRVYYPYSRDHVVPGGLFEIDDYLGWKLAKGKSATHHTRYFETTYRINSLGYRDKPRKLQKDREDYRILLYGDSQTFGWGTPTEQRFSNLIEDQRAQLEMWNLSVPGYGIDQEVLSYEKGGQNLNADEVFFFVSRATLDRARYKNIYRKNKPIFIIDQNDGLRLIRIQRQASAWTRSLYEILSPLYLPYFVERRLAILKQLSEQVDNQSVQKMAIGSDVISELHIRILKRARNIARKQEHRMSIITDLPRNTGNDLKKFCEQMNIGYLRLPLKKEDPYYRFGEHDSHWNPRAHRLISELLITYLETNNSLVDKGE